MLTPLSCLVPNTVEIAAKVLDGEAILINLSTGVYYSMDKVGASVWTFINEGYAINDIANALSAFYVIDAAQAQNDVMVLLEELLREKIVSLAENSTTQRKSAPEYSGQKADYEPPKLNVYRDMGDLLALDPPMPGLADLAEFNE